MPEVTLRHEIDTDEVTYWTKLVFDADFNRKMYMEHLGFPQWKLVELQDDADKATRRVSIEPPLGDLPAPLKKLAGNRFGYTEEGTLDKKAWRYSFRIVPSVMAEKARIVGNVHTETVGDKKIVRHCRISAEVKILMVGSMIEERLVTQLRSSYDRGVSFMNAFIKEHHL